MAPPGWYPDPWRQAPLRWWDGREWTANTLTPTVGVTPILDLGREEQACRRVRWAAIILAAGQVVAVLAFGFMARGAREMITYLMANPAPETAPEGSGTFGLAFAMLLVYSPLGLTTQVLLVVWFHRAVANGAALGLRGPRDPTVAVISLFIPILSFWWPYESLRDCVPSSAAATRKRILRWWLLYLFGPLTWILGAPIAAFNLPAFAGVVLFVVAVALVLAHETAGVVRDVLQAHRLVAGLEIDLATPGL